MHLALRYNYLLVYVCQYNFQEESQFISLSISYSRKQTSSFPLFSLPRYKLFVKFKYSFFFQNSEFVPIVCRRIFLFISYCLYSSSPVSFFSPFVPSSPCFFLISVCLPLSLFSLLFLPTLVSFPLSLLSLCFS